MATYHRDAKQPVSSAKSCPPKLWSMPTPDSVPDQERKRTNALGESKETGGCHPLSSAFLNLNRTNCKLPFTGAGAIGSIPLSRTAVEHRQEASAPMNLREFLSKQFIDVIDWVEPESNSGKCEGEGLEAGKAGSPRGLIPARTRSTIKLRSSFATAPSTVKTILPADVLVSTCSDGSRT
jgi:hypothetical protein